MKTSYIFLAPGFEEIEALATVDILRRGGMEVRTVAIATEGGKEVTGAHGVGVMADLLPEEVDLDQTEWLICPGGMPGAQHLADSSFVKEALLSHYGRGGKIAAICASPALVLTPLGLLDGLKATCYPGMEPENAKVEMTGEQVVVLDRIITGNGPATTFHFALAILEKTLGEAISHSVGEGMLFYHQS
ncbi:MAG: DJ-1/PfpI family protein [Paramuribaculum sp.]|nr:DJ-1/PfpI family protein [Paramuribaculum sp.]